MEAKGIVALVFILLRFVQSIEQPLPSPEPLQVPMTLVQNATATDALCLDGSLPGYHLHRGFGAGARNWLLQFEGGGWCNDIKSCMDRAKTRRGSTKFMTPWQIFIGIMSNDPAQNPDFYNWNRVKLRYCDGASFSGDADYDDGESLLYFRGQRIWHAMIKDLLPQGLAQAEKALLGGCSAGGLASFLHCESFSSYLPNAATVKCFSDGGFFLDAKDISSSFKMRDFYQKLITLQGVEQNLDKNCTSSLLFPAGPDQCFFPQYVLNYIKTPFFVLNSAYDVFQFHHIFVPPSADPRGDWGRCSVNPAECGSSQIELLEGYRDEMIAALSPLENSAGGGMFIDSCFSHCQSESENTWFAPDSTRIKNKTIAEAVGDWYFDREDTKEVDCSSYPCNPTCKNLIPEPTARP